MDYDDNCDGCDDNDGEMSFESRDNCVKKSVCRVNKSDEIPKAESDDKAARLSKGIWYGLDIKRPDFVKTYAHTRNKRWNIHDKCDNTELV
mmetsp:Transcript_10121/g.8878  ORF Transcript_10121/g.8878 Transcript_10121/m.8878 type:complete len:91 (+) Transcript_10121:1484-1756(+)